MAISVNWLQGVQYPAAQDRLLIEAAFRFPGIIGAASFKVVANGGMQVAIGAGKAVVLGTGSSNQGMYVVRSTAQEVLTLDPAPGSGSRIDRIILRVYDNNADSSGRNEAVVEVVKGTASGSPATPAEPQTAITLATVAVGTGVGSINSGNITSQRKMTGPWHTGDVVFNVGNTTEQVPADSVLGAGQIVNISDEPDLYEWCAGRFNTGGEPGGTFRMPNLCGRVVMGMDNMGLGANNIVNNATASGAKGGVESAAISLSELPPHGGNVLLTNTVGDHSHALSAIKYTAGGGNAPLVSIGANLAAGISELTDHTGDHFHAVTLPTWGGGAARSNMQPWIAFVAYIKR